MAKIPRKLSLVKFDFDGTPKEQHIYFEHFKKEKVFVFLGEIPNMPGHCVIAGSSGKVHFGYHTDNFIELTEDET